MTLETHMMVLAKEWLELTRIEKAIRKRRLVLAHDVIYDLLEDNEAVTQELEHLMISTQ